MVYQNIVPLIGAFGGLLVGGFFGYWSRERKALLVAPVMVGFLTACFAARVFGLFQRPEPTNLQISAAWFFALFGLPLLILTGKLILKIWTLLCLTGICSFMSVFGFLWRSISTFGICSEALVVRLFRDAHGQKPRTAPAPSPRSMSKRARPISVSTNANGQWYHPPVELRAPRTLSTNLLPASSNGQSVHDSQLFDDSEPVEVRCDIWPCDTRGMSDDWRWKHHYCFKTRQQSWFCPSHTSAADECDLCDDWKSTSVKTI